MSSFSGLRLRITVNHMQLTDDDLRAFVQTWSDEFKEPIGIEDARIPAAMLLDLYLLLASFGEEESQ